MRILHASVMNLFGVFFLGLVLFFFTFCFSLGSLATTKSNNLKILQVWWKNKTLHRQKITRSVFNNLFHYCVKKPIHKDWQHCVRVVHLTLHIRLRFRVMFFVHEGLLSMLLLRTFLEKIGLQHSALRFLYLPCNTTISPLLFSLFLFCYVLLFSGENIFPLVFWHYT